MTSLLNDPGLLEAEHELAQLQLSPLQSLPSAAFTTALLHQVIHEYLGQTYDYQPFLAATAATSASSSSGLPSSTTSHRLIPALQVWLRSLLRSLPGIGSNPELKTEAERKAEVEYVRESVAKLGVSEEISKALVSGYLAREVELLAQAKRLSVTQFSEWSLKDYDWSARVTLASSSISNLKEPKLLLTLRLGAPDGRERTVQLELDQAGLDSVLEQLGKVNAVVQDFSTTTSA